jgi:hypothetical protein
VKRNPNSCPTYTTEKLMETQFQLQILKK